MHGNKQDSTVWKAVLLLQAISSELVYQAWHKEKQLSIFSVHFPIFQFISIFFSNAIFCCNSSSNHSSVFLSIPFILIALALTHF